MRKKKVLFVVHQLNHGGVQKALISALNAIDYTENEVTLYVRKNRIQLLPDVNENVHKIIVNEDQTHYYRKPYAAVLLLLKKLCGIIKLKKMDEAIQKKLVKFINESQMEYEKNHYFANQEAYDVAISYIQGYTAKFVAHYIKAKRKVMFFHGSTDETHELHEEIMPCFNAIVGVNENVQKVLEGLYPAFANKMTFIENYVDATEVRNKSQEFKIEKPEGKHVLCSCGRFTPVKGFDLAVEAAKILKEQNVEFLWYFVGDGSERAKIEQMIKQYGLEDCIQITGMQDNPYSYMNVCDIYVQPSYEESHSLTIVEALILCKPIVSTATVGGKTLIVPNRNGLLADIEESDLVDKISEMISQNNLYREICNNLKEIDYGESLKKYQDAWKRVLEG